MKNIHLFETDDAYNAAKSGLILPRLSYIKESQDVKYNPTFDANGHDFVEIAGIKLATMNVGANSITDYGLYFQWGDTQGNTEQEIYDNYRCQMDWSDYTWWHISDNNFTKYYSGDNKTVLELADDAVHAAWGGSWRMPTKGEMDTILSSTAVTKTWKTGYNGTSVAGYEFHDKNSNDTLFFPACGFGFNGDVEETGLECCYWLNSLNTDNVIEAYCLYGTGVNTFNRYNGLCVRGVLAEN